MARLAPLDFTRRVLKEGGAGVEVARGEGFPLCSPVRDPFVDRVAGAWVLVLAGVFVAEIVITLTDFVVEIAVRRQLGDVYAGERVTHAVMGILYGAVVANLFPVLMDWWTRPTALIVEGADIQTVVQWGLFVMAASVFRSGVRDLSAALESRKAACRSDCEEHLL